MPTPTSIYVESGAGQTAQVLHAFLAPIVCRVRDENGDFMAGVGVTFLLPVTPTFSPAGFFGAEGTNSFIAFTDVNGRATSGVITANIQQGAWSGSVGINGFAISASFGLANSNGAPTPSTIQITANGEQMAAQNAAYLPVTARLIDQYGAGVVSQSLTMTVDGARGTFVGGGTARNVLTDSAGYATFPAIVATSVTGPFNPQVTFPSIPVASATFTTVDATIPTNVAAYSGSGQNAPLGAQFAAPLVALVGNALGGPVAGIAVVFDAPNAQPTLTWDSPPAADPVTVFSDTNGLATTPIPRAGGTAGTYNVTATVTGVPARIFQLTNGGAPPASTINALLLCEV